MNPVLRTWALHMVDIKLMDLGADLVWEIQHGDYNRGVRLALGCKRLREWRIAHS